ncbi:phage tail protein [Bacillus thuringiensis]|uniref:phage tail protein n=1 Tax=Bacillus thuringiensis TaxID=1428 RepID=UPI0021E84366|nr:phage tail protein [Bacillus thuringiensis]
MAVTNKEIQYSVGVEDLYICMMAGDEATDALPTYEEDIYKQTNISDLTISTTSTNFTKWASNKKIINIVKNTAFGLAFNLAGLNREVKDKIFAKERKKGVSFETAKAKEYPKFAVGVVFPLNDGTKLVRWYPKCTIAPVEESWKTQNEEMVVDDIAYTITADPLLFNDVTQAELDTGSADAKGIKVEDFLKQVICDESQLEQLGETTPPETKVNTSKE